MGGIIATKLINGIYGILFPTPAPITLEQILDAVSELLNQRLDTYNHRRVYLELGGTSKF
ncbi:hypothetical protein BTW32_25710 [Bacillus thuringiensis]|nr:hypothetical protein BTW32_25710 [Bacillus thuringiensis]